MQLMVTGSSGFIGRDVCKKLSKDGHGITYIDPIDSSGDIRNPEDLSNKAKNCDGIIHLGAIASVPASIKYPKNVYDVNVIGARNVFKAAVKAGNIPVVYASSTAIYGDNPNLPLNEKTAPQPRSPYAEYKLQNEKDAAEFGQKNGLPSFGVRLFNVYGAGQDSNSPYCGVVPLFHEQLKNQKPITIHGDGKQSRDFVYIDDAVDAILMALEHCSAKAPVANICTGTATSLLELTDLMGTILETAPEIHFNKERKGDIKHSCGDPSLFEAITGFKAATSLQDGLHKMIQGFKS